MSIAYGVGFLCGLLVVVIASLILRKTVFKGDRKPQYDERQTQEQNRAGRVALFVLIIYNTLYGIVESMFGGLPFSVFTAMYIGVLIAILVYCCMCIWNEAYFAINQNATKWIIFFYALAAFNIVIGILNAKVNGSGANWTLNFCVGVMCLVVATVAWIKMIRVRRDAEELDAAETDGFEKPEESEK